MKAVASIAAGSERVRRYFTLLGWLSRDALWRFRRPVWVVIGAGLAGVSLQGSAIGVALLYARAVEVGDPVTVPILGQTFDPRADVALLFGAVVGAGLLMTAAAALTFWARNTGIAADRRYVRFATQRVLGLVSHLPDFRCPQASGGLHPRLITQLQRDIRYTGRILRILLRSVSAIVTAVVALVAVLLVNAALTAVVVALTAVAGYWLYRVSARGAAHSMTFERHMGGARTDRSEVIAALGSQPDPLPADAPELNLVDRVPYRRYLDAYYGRIRSTEWSELVTLTLTAVALVVILLIEGLSILRGDSSFTALILYLVALRYFLNGVVRTGRLAVSINRFYPQARRHMLFVTEATTATQPRPPVALGGLRTRVPGLDRSAEDPWIEPGSVIGLIHPGPLDRYTVAQVVAGLQPVTPNDDDAAPALSFALDPAGLAVDAPVQNRQAANHGGRTALAVEPDVSVSASHRHQVLVVPATLLTDLPGNTRQTLRDRLADGLLVVAHRWPSDAIGDHGEQLHLVVTRDGLAGWAPTSWIKANAEHVDELLPARSAEGGYLDEDDDDE